MKIKGFKIQGNDISNPIFFGSMKVEDLLKVTEVDMFQAGHQSGYQRQLSEARAKAFGRFILAGNMSPTTLLLNIREGKIKEEKFGAIDIEDAKTIWLVDGQHRREGLKYAAERREDIKEMEYPVIIMNQPSSYEEAKQFVIINKNQKGVRTDLAQRFLMQAVNKEGRENLRKMRDSGALTGVGLKDFEWNTAAIEITDILNNDKKHIWHSKIRLPNEPKDGTIVTQGAFSTSLEPILKDSIFEGKPVQGIASAIGNYWDGIKELCEAAFENPDSYAIQKTTGVFVLHKIFPRVVEFCRDENGNLVLTKEKIKSVLEGLGFMNSEYWDSKIGDAGIRGTSRKAFAGLALEALEILENNREKKASKLIL